MSTVFLPSLTVDLPCSPKVNVSAPLLITTYQQGLQIEHRLPSFGLSGCYVPLNLASWNLFISRPQNLKETCCLRSLQPHILLSFRPWDWGRPSGVKPLLLYRTDIILSVPARRNYSWPSRTDLWSKAEIRAPISRAPMDFTRFVDKCFQCVSVF